MLATDLLNSWPRERWSHRKLLVAVSGGADSVALLLALTELARPDRLVCAHFNHGWRGNESDSDETFVVNLCKQVSVPLAVGRSKCHSSSSAEIADKTSLEKTGCQRPLPSQPSNGQRACDPTHIGAQVGESMHRQPVDQDDDNTCVNPAMHAKRFSAHSEVGYRTQKSEERAREDRYDFLIKAAYECGASYVVTGHTADDRIETLLHNLFRGSGLSGAASLRTYRKLDSDLVIARPLLSRTREDVLSFLQSRGQSYRHDASNDNQNYARNYIRQNILPAVRAHYPSASSHLMNFSELVEEALDDIDLLATAWLEQVAGLQPGWPPNATNSAWRGDYWVIPAVAAVEQPWTVVRAALRRVWLERHWPMQAMDRVHWDTLRHILQSAAADLQRAKPSAQEKVVRVLHILPGAIRVEVAGDFVALGRERTAS